MRASSKRLLQIGVTGGIGSGKTTVCEIFSRLGVPVLSSDNISKELTHTDPKIREELTALLGDDAYLPDRSCNRTFVASRIFSSKELQSKVEGIIHPRVEQERKRRITELLNQGHRMVVIEAALIYEVGLDQKLDIIVLVDADEMLRIQRTCARMGISEKEVRVRIDAQLDVKKKIERAEYIIQNNGTLSELESKVRLLHTIFQQLAIGR